MNLKSAMRLFTRREVCPKCGSGKVRLSESLLEHIRRFFAGSRKRFCIACGTKWSTQISKTALAMRKKTIWMISSAIVILFLLILWSIWDPKTAQDMENEEGPHVQTRVDKETPLSV